MSFVRNIIDWERFFQVIIKLRFFMMRYPSRIVHLHHERLTRRESRLKIFHRWPWLTLLHHLSVRETIENERLSIINDNLVDANEAGSGNLEIAVACNEKNIPNYVQNEGGTRFRVKFIPTQPMAHYVHMKFNGLDIPGKNNHRFNFDDKKISSLI